MQQAHLKSHHETLWRALAPVEHARKLHADVHIVEVEVLPACLPVTQQLGQLWYLAPHVAATLLRLDLQAGRRSQATNVGAEAHSAHAALPGEAR
eukprot:GHRQ01013073.1.p2 GENE.GHRQ01013073.1~~GHRQ01013073.1.p2  ORF type:complete len:111 (+),score=7.06 GHRQ01013073.1:49-333(+)